MSVRCVVWGVAFGVRVAGSGRGGVGCGLWGVRYGLKGVVSGVKRVRCEV